jgi:hypothetical protein
VYRYPCVFQLQPSYQPPAGVAPQVVFDQATDPEHPFTITYHLTADQFDLIGHLASGRASFLGSHRRDDLPPGPPLIELQRA